MKKILASILLLWVSMAWTQEPVKWLHNVVQIDSVTYEIQHRANIDANWHLYSQFSNPEGAIPTEFLYDTTSNTLSLVGDVNESESITAFDTVFEMNLTYFETSAQFSQRLRFEDPTTDRIAGEINYQACDDKLCIFRTESFVLSRNGEQIQTQRVVSSEGYDKAAALQLNLQNKDVMYSPDWLESDP